MVIFHSYVKLPDGICVWWNTETPEARVKTSEDKHMELWRQVSPVSLSRRSQVSVTWVRSCFLLGRTTATTTTTATAAATTTSLVWWPTCWAWAWHAGCGLAGLAAAALGGLVGHLRISEVMPWLPSFYLLRYQLIPKACHGFWIISCWAHC